MTSSHNSFDRCRCGQPKDTRADECRECFVAKVATPEQMQFLRENIDRLSWAELARAVGRKLAAVRGIAARNGIVKSPETVRETLRRNRHGALTATERYWTHVVKSDGCWGWSGSTDGNGYGVFGSDGRRFKAHRFSYELHHGPIPEGMGVLHRCDNPPCSRPDHLFAGTQRDNLADAAAKDRVEFAERHHAAKLTTAAVVDARARHASGERIVDIARELRVTESAIRSALKGKTWRRAQ